MERKDACAQYFRQRPGWRRILTAMLEKYRGLGRVGGSIRLNDADEAEYEAVRALFGRPFCVQEKHTKTAICRFT